MDLGAIFDNRGGSRKINIKSLSSKGKKTKTNVGQMDMDNRGGNADIAIGSASEAGS